MASAGFNRFTELDQFDDWLIERKFDSGNEKFLCRASMPKYGSWFGSRIRLDKNEELVVPEALKGLILPKTFPMKKIKKSLKDCQENLIYVPQKR